jgi:hypothetical protein
MSTLSLLDAIERPSILGPDRDRRDAGRVPTLEDLISGTWTALTSARPAACPICDGHLEARYGAGHNAVAGRCRRCGTELS